MPPQVAGWSCGWRAGLRATRHPPACARHGRRIAIPMKAARMSARWRTVASAPGPGALHRHLGIPRPLMATAIHLPQALNLCRLPVPSCLSPRTQAYEYREKPRRVTPNSKRNGHVHDPTRHYPNQEPLANSRRISPTRIPPHRPRRWVTWQLLRFPRHRPLMPLARRTCTYANSSS